MIVAGTRETRACDMAGRGNRIIEFGAVCLRLSSDSDPKAEVLLMMDRDNERWTIPTGRRMPKVLPRDIIQQTTWMMAKRLKGPVWKGALGQFSYLRAVGDGSHAMVQVRVHIVNVSKTQTRDPDRHRCEIQWVAPDQACEMVHEPALAALMAKVPDEVSRLLKRMVRSPTALDLLRAHRAIGAITSRSGLRDGVALNRQLRAARLFPSGGKDEPADFVPKATHEFRRERGP